ncbi:MAG TPA: hypothetical protein VLN91_02645, partial [Nitrospirota bacterium]|nr:hypothetical protein [Nitrospirota bacterium]
PAIIRSKESTRRKDMREAVRNINAPTARFSRDAIIRKATNTESSSSTIDKPIMNREMVIIYIFYSPLFVAYGFLKRRALLRHQSMQPPLIT